MDEQRAKRLVASVLIRAIDDWRRLCNAPPTATNSKRCIGYVSQKWQELNAFLASDWSWRLCEFVGIDHDILEDLFKHIYRGSELQRLWGWIAARARVKQ